MNNGLKNKGFTLIELMTTIALVAIVAALAVPSMNSVIQNSRLAAFSNDFVSSIGLARNEAIGSREQVIIIPAAAGWNAGWRVIIDEDKNGALTTGEEVVKQVEAYPASISENAAPAGNIILTSNGAMINLGGWGSLTMCDDRDAGRTFDIAGSGNVSVTKIDVGACI